MNDLKDFDVDFNIKDETGGEKMESLPVNDLPEDLARMVARFADYLRWNLRTIENRRNGKDVKPSDFHEGPLGVKEPLTRKEIYEDD